MPRAIVIGGGLAGIAAAAALASAGVEVDLLEARPFLGGRATSYPVHPAEENSELIDNCQHVLLRCFHNLLDLYRRLGVYDKIRFHRELYFVEPGGRVSRFNSHHLLGSFLRARFLGLRDKFAIARGLRALARESDRRDLDRISMLDWLREKRQTPRAIERFWRQVLVSAINEDLDRMAAAHGFQVFRLGFLSRSEAPDMGLAAVPLRDLYAAPLRGVTVHTRAAVERIAIGSELAAGVLVDGEWRRADYYVCCLPFERLPAVAPELGLDLSGFEHSPITGIHLWFNRRVLKLPHATLLDRTIQWVFDKGEGRYVQVVISASRSLLAMHRADIVGLAVRELGEFFPRVARSKVERAHVVKEARATFSARCGLEVLRPGPKTPFANLFLAGDWTRTGWPATMEGAVRSGYAAAEAVTRAAGAPRTFLLPDVY